MRKAIYSASCALLLVLAAAAQPPAADNSTGVPVSVLVSVQAKHGGEVPTIYPEDVRISSKGAQLKVADWVPLRGDNAGLQLYLLIDDSLNTIVGSQFQDLRTFINQQPATTEIAVGYIRFGTVYVTQPLTTNHAVTAKALRLPLGRGTMASPFVALTDFMKHWPESEKRREIFVVTSGVDALDPGTQNVYLDHTIEEAQRTGIQIYTIYATLTGRMDNAESTLTWGPNNLLKVTHETGGDAYFQALTTPISFGPYMDKFTTRLENQYRLTFLAPPGWEGELTRIKLDTEVPNAELVAAERVYVSGAR